MAVIALTAVSVQIAAATSGGTAPGGSAAPTGCNLTTPTELNGWVTLSNAGVQVATLDATTFGSGGFVTMVAGLKSATLVLTVLQDYAAAAPNALLGINGSVIAFGSTGFMEVKVTTAGRSSTNPAFVCKVINKGWSPFNVTVGQLGTVSFDLQVIGGFGELVA